MRILMLPLTFALLIFTSPLLAQEAGDTEAIRATVNNYFEGIKERDRSKLEKAFLDSNVHTKYVRGEQGILAGDLEETLTRFSAGAKNPDLKGHILSINIYHPTAAFVAFDFNDTFIDGLQLIKMNGNWRILNKTFVNK